ncbi:MAG: PP2C family protein-serine/threonine phosphatase [bacterium]|nr:PP2C family protein-serine/threonine phosphatase [bacterium]
MRIFKHLQIGLKLAGLISILLVLILVISWLNIGHMARIGDELKAITGVDIPLGKAVTEVTIGQLEQAIRYERALRLAAEGDKRGLATAVAEFANYAQLVNKVLDKARADMDGAHRRTLPEGMQDVVKSIETQLDAIAQEHDAYEDHVRQVFNHLRKTDLASAYALLERVEKKDEELDHRLEQFLLNIESFTETSAAAARDHEIVAARQARVITGISLFFAIITSFVLIRSITRPLKVLIAATRNVAEGDFDVELNIDWRGARDELAKLAGAFLTMTQALKQYINKLAETTAAKERIESELNIARDIQLSILRKNFEAFEERRELDIFAVVESAREVGGDLYDFSFVDNNRFFFAIGDVSGKGVPASLYMAVTSTLIKAVARRIEEPGRMLKLVNDELAEENDACMFVTLFCGVIDTDTGEVVYANAGHNPPLLLRHSGECDFIRVKPGVSAGAMEGMDFETHRLRLEPGDSLFLYTDGVTEAMNRSEELFSSERLKNSLINQQGTGMEDMVAGVLAEVKDFSRGVPQFDDITMLALRYTAGKNCA